MHQLFSAAYLSVFALDALVMWTAPRFLAPLARLPISARRSVALPSSVATALSFYADTASDYRTAPEQRFDLARLPGPSIIDGDKEVLTVLPGGEEIMARRAFSLSRKARPIVFVRMRVEGDRLALDARYYPSHLTSIFVFVLVACAMAHSAAPLLVLGLFALFAYFGERKAATALFDSVEAEVASRVRQLAAQSTPVQMRVAQALAVQDARDVEESATGGEAPQRRAG